MKIRAVVFCVGSSLLLGNVSYAEDRNWYAGVDAAYSILGTKNATGSVLNLQTDFKDGVAFGGVFGYDHGSYRTEIEIGKHIHNADRFNITNDGGLGLGAGNQNATSGKSNTTHYMANVIYDLEKFNLGDNIEPFVGTGLGFANVKWNNLATPSAVFTNGSKNAFSYHLFGGVRYALSENVELSLKYRYFKATSVNMLDRLSNSFDTKYATHDLGVGLTFRFGSSKKEQAPVMAQVTQAPPPAPAPAPAVEEPIAPVVVNTPEPTIIVKEPHTVYFDWDSSEIDETAYNIIGIASEEAKENQDVTIKLDGHADTSGPDKYNDELSLERATAVRNALISRGVNGSLISIEGHGERMPEVSTPDNVREKQNRRVKILIN